MADYGSPPRWRAWATGDPNSPRRVHGESPTAPPPTPPALLLTGEVQGDPNAYAVEVMERGFAQYMWVRDTTDPKMWAWSKPLWQALFGTANALTPTPASPRVAQIIEQAFYGVGDTLPCRLCAAHMGEKMAETFPTHHMSNATLSQWMRDLKAEVDERVQRRKAGFPEAPSRVAVSPVPASTWRVGAAASPPASPSAAASPPLYASQGVHPASPRPAGRNPPPGFVAHSPPRAYAAATPPPRSPPLPPTHGGAGGYTAPPSPAVGYAYGQLAHPAHTSYSPLPATPSPPRATRTPWAELQSFQAVNGLCTHGVAPHMCELCVRRAAPGRAMMR